MLCCLTPSITAKGEKRVRGGGGLGGDKKNKSKIWLGKNEQVENTHVGYRHGNRTSFRKPGGKGANEWEEHLLHLMIRYAQCQSK